MGLLLFTWWITALASGEESFATVQAVMDNPLGGLVLFGFTFAIFFHMANGVRHMVWDAGIGLEKEVAQHTSIVVVGLAALLTVLTWIVLLASG